MADSKLLGWGVGFGVVGLLLVGGAYLAFSDASESLEEDDVDVTCETFFGFCWLTGLPSGDLGCGSCLIGILLVILVVPILFGGLLSGLVGIWSVPEQVVVRQPLPPPAKPGVVIDEFAELESELESLDG